MPERQEAIVAKEFTVVIERDEDEWLVASVPSLPGCHTQARTMEDLLERTREAIAAYLELEDEGSGEPLQLVGIQRISGGWRRHNHSSR